jgi:hypothetical protein
MMTKIPRTCEPPSVVKYVRIPGTASLIPAEKGGVVLHL